MASLWQCDYCGAIYDDRGAVALLDVEFGGQIERKIHACPEHLPEGTFPAAETDPLADTEPVLSGEQWAEVVSSILPE